MDWYGLYREGWNREIVPEAFGHPAKFARGLIRHIYEHAIKEGWLAEGDTVLDSFGGVALGALDAMYQGLQWVGVELEAKFAVLGWENIALWNSRYSGLRRWGRAVILQGDSRQLGEIVRGGLDGIVSSPPYASGTVHDSGQDSAAFRARAHCSTGRTRDHWGTYKAGGFAADAYGTTPGQLGSMREGDFDAVVSSPPFQECLYQTERTMLTPHQRAEYGRNETAPSVIARSYGTTPGQLGQESEATFWASARQIVEQCYLLLRPGGHAIWVVKAFVRKGQRVDFPGQWRDLCEAVGFRTLHEHRAHLIEDKGAQHTLFGEVRRKRIERKSFFRRLAEKKGSPRIDWEIVLCMEKPL